MLLILNIFKDCKTVKMISFGRFQELFSFRMVTINTIYYPNQTWEEFDKKTCNNKKMAYLTSILSSFHESCAKHWAKMKLIFLSWLKTIKTNISKLFFNFCYFWINRKICTCPIDECWHSSSEKTIWST